MTDSFRSHGTLSVAGVSYTIARLDALARAGLAVDHLPFALKILVENLLRREDGAVVKAADIEALARWRPDDEPAHEIAYMPARVLMQDFTGVPAVVDLAAMRDAVARLGGDPSRVNPLQPAELVIDHSVQVDAWGSRAAMGVNTDLDYRRNSERYAFLRWGQTAFAGLKVVPPATGIVHQVNLEYLARVVMTGGGWAFPDTLVGTDSHTTMVNGLGVLGWGVGGIEAEAAMLGQPVSMLVPQVVGFRLDGELPEGATATDLVLCVTQMLRAHGVVGRFVEFFGPGLAGLTLADRATIANMAPEYGATCGLFPIDQVTLDYLRFTGRDQAQVALVEAYCKEQGLFHAPGATAAAYTSLLSLELGTVEPSLAGPRRPQDRVTLRQVPASFTGELEKLRATPASVEVSDRGTSYELRDGAVAIAAITSCTNTSNPAVMVAAGLVARAAVARGLSVKPWVKTSLAPGSKVVTEYLREAGLSSDLEALGFHVVGYGCTTCIGNSGPLPEAIAAAARDHQLVLAAVLSGNRNFEGRISSDVRANYLASPPLVVAYALAGRVDLDLTTEPLGHDRDGQAVFLRDLWPSSAEIERTVRAAVLPEHFASQYGAVYDGDERWRALPVPTGATYAWDPASTYVKEPPYFVDLPAQPSAVGDIVGARVLALFGDSITTDHISPAGSIKRDSPAGRYLLEHGVEAADFNSYGSRRGNHEVMVRGTFANVRLKNLLVPGVEGGVTRLLPEGEQMSIFDAAERYRERGVPLVVIAGTEYGTGSSRDWAAKGPKLLGVRAVLAESFERIHRSNLVGMGILPLELPAGATAASLGLDGREVFDLTGLAGADLATLQTVRVSARRDDGSTVAFDARLRLDTPQEAEYYRHGGILPYVLRQLA